MPQSLPASARVTFWTTVAALCMMTMQERRRGRFAASGPGSTGLAGRVSEQQRVRLLHAAGMPSQQLHAKQQAEGRSTDRRKRHYSRTEADSVRSPSCRPHGPRGSLEQGGRGFKTLEPEEQLSWSHKLSTPAPRCPSPQHGCGNSRMPRPQTSTTKSRISTSHPLAGAGPIGPASRTCHRNARHEEEGHQPTFPRRASASATEAPPAFRFLSDPGKLLSHCCSSLDRTRP